MRRIEVRGLTKEYGRLRAVDDLSFAIEPGEVVGFLGPNGAGKTTTLRILAGFLGPTRGSVCIDGREVSTFEASAREALGYMPEACPLYPELRVREYLTFRAELKGVRRSRRSAAVDEVLDRVGLRDVDDDLIGHLSKGLRQRVGLADALVGSPSLLILDEPTAGLDPNQVVEFRELVRELGRERTVLLSTHILSEVEATCSRALVLSQGRLVAEGSLEDLQARRRGRTLKLRLRCAHGSDQDLQNLDRLLRSEAQVEALHLETTRPSRGEAWTGEVCGTVALRDGSDPATTTEELIAKLVRAGCGVREATWERSSLEQVFARLTGAADDNSSSAQGGARS